MPDANNACPVISQLIRNVSMVPVTRQLTALARLRNGVSVILVTTLKSQMFELFLYLLFEM
jgi:hypothetical protein